MIRPSRVLPTLFLAASLSPLDTLASQTAYGVRLGLAAGMEVRGPWGQSVVGPTVAISLSTPMGPRIHVQGILAGSAGINTGGDVVALHSPGTGFAVGDRDPTAAFSATAELVLYDQPRHYGGYVLGGLGVVRFSGRDAPGAPVRPQLGVGLGGAIGKGAGQVYIEARLLYVVDASPYPKWFAPLRLGWRSRI